VKKTLLFRYCFPTFINLDCNAQEKLGLLSQIRNKESY